MRLYKMSFEKATYDCYAYKTDDYYNNVYINYHILIFLYITSYVNNIGVLI